MYLKHLECLAQGHTYIWNTKHNYFKGIKESFPEQDLTQVYAMFQSQNFTSVRSKSLPGAQESGEKEIYWNRN